MEAPSALIILASGAEEMEVTIVADLLRRASVRVVLAGLDGEQPVKCSRGVQIVPDCRLSRVEDPADLVVLPGGAEGAERLARDPELGTLLEQQLRNQRWLGAICAAPIALQQHRIGFGKRLTSHPSVKNLLLANYQWCDEAVCEDGKLITSQGPGTSFEFALRLIERLCGTEIERQVRAPLCLS